MRKILRTIIMLVIGFNFVTIGLGIPLFLAYDSEFKCTRTSGNDGDCIYIEKGLVFTNSDKFNLKGINKTRVENSADKEERGGSSSVILVMDNGDTHNISSGESGYCLKEKYEYSNQINEFINNPKLKTLNAEYKGAWMLYLFGGIFAVVGTALILGAIFPFFRKV